MMRVALLGASGSIGTQTMDVMMKNREDFRLVSFSLGKRTRQIAGILKRFPEVRKVCVLDGRKTKYYSSRYPGVEFFSGDEGLKAIASDENADMVVNALVGFAGLVPTITALQNDKILALANKESLVVGGELVNRLLDEGHGKLFPIDSEHAALHKCLAVQNENVEKLIITASGGAFRNLTRDQLKDVTPEDALKHPTWKMGRKITIDSASMVNKTFEIIEAHYLFGYPSDRIDVLMNYESYVHSLVKYNGGTYRMEVGKPDMRKPIKYAIYQGKIPFDTVVTDTLSGHPGITFHDFSRERYPITRYAETVISRKGTYGAVLNAANEEAVYAFLDHRIAFLDIENIIAELMDRHVSLENPTLDDLIRMDRKTREEADEIIRERSR